MCACYVCNTIYYSQTTLTNATNCASLYLSFSSFSSLVLPFWPRSPSRTLKLVQPSSNFSACATYAIDRFSRDSTDTAKPDESSRGDERKGKNRNGKEKVARDLYFTSYHQYYFRPRFTAIQQQLGEFLGATRTATYIMPVVVGNVARATITATGNVS